MGFLDEMRSLKEGEVQGLDPASFGERERGVYNPLRFLREAPVIAEVKPASPTAGRIRDVDPVRQAIAYQRGGAGAVSVLVDESYFGGSWHNLKSVAHGVNLPVLCKEFILSEKQIDAAYRCGADFVLLIYGFVEEGRLSELAAFAKEKGLFVLLEVFDPEQLEGALELDFWDMLGVNSRNLQDLTVDLGRAAGMLSRIPEGVFKVGESGVRSLEDARFLFDAGADALLVGEFLMRQDNPEVVLRELVHVREDMRHQG